MNYNSDSPKLDEDWTNHYAQLITVSEFRPKTAGTALMRPTLVWMPRRDVIKQKQAVMANISALTIGTQNSTVTKLSSMPETTKNSRVLGKSVQTTSRHELQPDVKPAAFGTDIFGNLRRTVIFNSPRQRRASSQSMQTSELSLLRRRPSNIDHFVQSVPNVPSGQHQSLICPDKSLISPHKASVGLHEVSFRRKRQVWGKCYNRIKRKHDDQKGFLVEACEETAGDVLQPKYSVISPKTSSPRETRRVRKSDHVFGPLKNSLLSLIA
jgi:hypothetical protein